MNRVKYRIRNLSSAPLSIMGPKNCLRIEGLSDKVYEMSENAWKTFLPRLRAKPHFKIEKVVEDAPKSTATAAAAPAATGSTKSQAKASKASADTAKAETANKGE